MPALEEPPTIQSEEDEIRGMEARVDPPDRMEDDLHIPHLQTEYPPTYSESHFSTAHPSWPPLMPSHTQPPPEQPSLHELRAEFHALSMDIHDMRDDITSLHGSFDESSDRHNT